MNSVQEQNRKMSQTLSKNQTVPNLRSKEKKLKLLRKRCLKCRDSQKLFTKYQF